MKDIITITNQKGGIGKSTTAQAVGAFLSLEGYKTLLIDLDPQANLTISAGANKNDTRILEVLSGKTKSSQIIQPIKKNLDILASNKGLSVADLQLTSTGKEYKLREALEPLYKQYDYFVIDTPPSLNILTVNALTASTKVVIPAQADLFSLEAIKDLVETIEAIKRYTNPSLKLEGILLTRYQPRAILTKELTERITRLASGVGSKVFKNKIREAIAIKEAQVMKEDIFTYSQNSKVASDYRGFMKELIKE